jgi:parallel beta-helix repeat protein
MPILIPPHLFSKISLFMILADDGRVIAVDNVITGNQTHGVTIGPRGSAILERNIIENNNQDGICCYGSMDNKLAMLYCVLFPLQYHHQNIKLLLLHIVRKCIFL